MIMYEGRKVTYEIVHCGIGRWYLHIISFSIFLYHSAPGFLAYASLAPSLKVSEKQLTGTAPFPPSSASKPSGYVFGALTLSG